MRRFVIAAFVTALLAAGCSSSPTTPTAANTPAVNPTTPAAPPPTSTSPSPSPSPAGPPPLGTTQTYTENDGTITYDVSSYKVVTVAADTPEGATVGTHIATITVKACLHLSNPSTLTWHAWSLIYPDGSAIQPLTMYSASDFPAPLYPNDLGAAIPEGDCRTGLIPFGLPSGATGKPAKVEWAVDAGTLSWSIG